MKELSNSFNSNARPLIKTIFINLPNSDDCSWEQVEIISQSKIYSCEKCLINYSSRKEYIKHQKNTHKLRSLHGACKKNLYKL